MSDTTRFQSFEEFWPSYVRAHSKPLTRLIHAVGTTSGVAVAGVAALTRQRWLLPLALVAGYGPAWFSHFFIEGNRPATFQHPLWSLRGDFEMIARMLQGTMAAEVQRCIDLEKAASADHDSTAPAAPAASAEPVTVTNGHARTLH